MKTRKFEEELAELKKTVNSLEVHISSLRTELAKRPMPTRQEPVITPMNPTPTPAAPAANNKSNSSHPRQGKYNSDDVSIEKYFNFSRK